MMKLRPILVPAFFAFAFAFALQAQQRPELGLTIKSLDPEHAELTTDLTTGFTTADHGVLVIYGDAVLTAERATIDPSSGEVVADGDVRIQQGGQFYSSQHINYNFKTHQMHAEQFRTGETPVFAAGSGLYGDLTNHVYFATNALLTTDDIANPAYRVKARRIKIIPGKKIQAYGATLYLGNVPVFYFPYFSRNIGEHSNNFNFTPGYRSLYGPFILGNYTWYCNDELNGVMHLDYYETRGVGAGPDFNYNLGRWGEGSFRYYYIHDSQPEIDGLGVPISQDRQRVYFAYQANPATNLYVKSLVRYESDLALTRDFFEGEYVLDPQPDSFFEANKFWNNWSLDAYAQPRVNNFLEEVERLPDIKLTGYRQQIGETPVYYASETSIGYYHRVFASALATNGAPTGLDYGAARADTYHQLLLPETFFGWLNFTPHIGGRLTYYSQATGPGATTDEQTRGVFDTGAEVSFKAYRLWPDAKSSLFQVDGLRHIIQPSAEYLFVPSPTVAPNQLPQFDYDLPSLRLLPLLFPDYNNIDSIDSENVIRWGLLNKLQTKRDGQVVNLVNWDVYADWRLKPRSDQTTFSDIYSDATINPFSWLTLESLTRFDVSSNEFSMAYETLEIHPGSTWSWRLGQYYLRDDLAPVPTALGPGNNVYTSSFFFKLNENWGLRLTHYFDARSGRLQEQDYTVYRDMRSWTAALTFLSRNNPIGPQDYTVAFTFSLKAYPHFPLGSDTGGPYTLLGM